MAIKKNNPIVKNHFRKHWQERVRVHLDQAGKKASRRTARAKKAAAIAPRPLDLLRPTVRANTIKYNRKVRAGRGFSREELKAAGIIYAQALSIGIAVDPRRQNKSVEAFEVNVRKLKEYKSKLILLPRNAEKVKAGEVSAKEFQAAKQVASSNAIIPVVQDTIETGLRAVPSSSESAFLTLRKARSDAKYAGMREKKARDAAEAEAEKKK